jgi:hypothetical protein
MCNRLWPLCALYELLTRSLRVFGCDDEWTLKDIPVMPVAPDAIKEASLQEPDGEAKGT